MKINIKKADALKQLEKLQNEMDKLKDIINKPVDLFTTIKGYSDVCEELGVAERTESDFLSKKEFRFHQLQNIQKLFNGDSTDNRHYPWFRKTGSGLVFYVSGDVFVDYFYGQVAYYKDSKTSDFIGKMFIDIYTDLQ